MEKYSQDKKCVVMSRDEVRAFDSWVMSIKWENISLGRKDDHVSDGK
ncbi:MAG TPA: hypothetical protein VMY06_09800 [Sedimentisphaerales bacterium]|nr:hypothetical protein [Sedimentisphaerales bacterium]